MLRASRTLWILLLSGAAAALLATAPAAAPPKEVKMGLIVPLSGPWARQGDLCRKGAEMAVEDINNAGGIKSLGGAKLKLVVADAGDSPEKAKNAAQRLVSQEPDMVAGQGSWLSSLTLAVTEVTERARLPWLTLSYADQITARGYHYVFQTSPTGDSQAQQMLPAIVALAEKATGKKPATVAIVNDNTAAPLSVVKPMVEGGGLERAGIKLVAHETFTPPLSDATPLIQKVRAARPDFLLLFPTNVPDDALLLQKLTEMGLPRTRLPVVGNGAHLATPELLKVAGKDVMEGVMVTLGNWPIKGAEELVAAFKKRTGEPWMTQDAISDYGHVMIVKQALEMAASTDREKVNQAIHAIDVTSGATQYFPGGRVRFDANGRRLEAPLITVQWQNGEPVTVGPPQFAVTPAIWTKK
jgi:branched-chain amino acid transport system substrate-binding protein